MRKELLYEISKPVVAAVGVQNVLQAIVESITKGTATKGCSLLLLSPDGKQLSTSWLLKCWRANHWLYPIWPATLECSTRKRPNERG